MGRMSRQKGARAELEIKNKLQKIVDEVSEEVGKQRLELRRNPSQRYTPKEYDIIGLPWIASEVKHYAKLTGPAQLNGWWRQLRAATREGQISVLFWKIDYQGWRVRMRAPVSVVKGGWSDGQGGPGATYHNPVRVWMVMDLDWESFELWFRLKLKYELTGKGNEPQSL